MKNILGNNESLRELFQGPIVDLLVKLNGDNGQEVLVELNKFNRREPCWILDSETQKSLPPDLKKTGQTFHDWLKARQEIHHFLTGERVDLLKMFIIPDHFLSRTDIMPVFRPVKATNRMAMNWKVKLGMNSSFEEEDVGRYSNSTGQEEPQLAFIRRSVRPDENTLDKNAKSPDGLIDIRLNQNQSWLNLFGWSTSDDLHYLITGKHLDSLDTLTGFPNDRLPGNWEVASGFWSSGRSQAYFDWSIRDDCNPFIGARLAEFFPLQKS